MESTERACCIVTVSGSYSDQRPLSCSGVILNPQAGVVLCSGLFSRFMNTKESVSPDLRFLPPDSFNDNLKICINYSEQRQLETNQCAYEACTVADSPSSNPLQATAELLFLINCVEFREAFLKMFRGSDKWGFYGGEEEAEMVRDSEFLSWFAVLKAPGLKPGVSKSGPIPMVNSSSLRKGCPVWACGSPFGNLCPDLFMSTLSKGIISNLAGEENVVILTDARCLPGTEGGGLFIPNGDQAYLAGLIVSPLCWKASELIGLTLVCSLQLILNNIMRCMKIHDPMGDIHLQEEPTDFESRTQTWAIQRHPTVALVDSGQFWGSGILVSSQLVLTCRHVVNGKSVVTLKFDSNDRYNDVMGDVLYSTKDSSPYDVAIVQLRDPTPEAVMPHLATSFQLGEDVVVVGYGALGQRCGGPSLTRGILSRALSWRSETIMLQTTCAVQAGTSGGAVVRVSSGELLGLVCSNTRDFTAKVTYPHLNFSIPVTVLQPLLRRYAQTGDVGLFRALDETEEGVRRVWRLQAPQSKL
ncbi:peroxisomal leader peptide-processing protease [Hypomesus transpacificus]|uniref:peroxisomal leader peptide-processing protease n=1 Tax=Hypomesus transpacificus TaxID=137520 RepID=UPI001F074C0F|nr:peroxisomal leader peptide-processing protease [Hypomesus transpacificus]